MAQLAPYQDILVADPPALGADFTYTVPGDTRVRIVTAMATLTCAAGGADRGVSLQFYTWNNRRFLVAGTAAKVAAGTAQAFVWQSAAAAGVWAVDDSALAGMPELTLLPMCKAKIHVDGMQAGDQLSEITLALDIFPPADTEPASVAFPLMDAVAELNIEGLREDLAALRGELRDVTNALGASRRQQLFALRT